MYEVINISTTTRRYIANGILTHNKTICGDFVTARQIVPFTVLFEPNYVPAYPFTFTFRFTSTCDTVCGSATASPLTATATSGGPDGIAKTVTILYRLSGTNTIVDYSLYGKAVDANNRNANNYVGPYGILTTGSKSYCLTPDTLIETYFGKQILLRDVKVGDELLSIDPHTMQYEKTIVTDKKVSLVDKLYTINDHSLKCSTGHQHVVKKRGEWTVLSSDELVIGDIMLTNDMKEFPITKIDIIE